MGRENTLSKEWFSKQKVDGIYVSTGEQLQDPLLTKYTGIYPTTFSFRYAQVAQKNILLCTPLEAGIVKQTYKGKIKAIRTRKDVLHTLKKYFGSKKIGVNLDYLTATQFAGLKKAFPKTKFKNISEALNDTRIIKTKEEIKKLKEAVSVTAETAKKIPNMLKRGMREIELAAEMDYQMARAGCDNAFSTIVAFGKNSTNIHHFPGNKKLEKNTMVLTDFGAKYKGYCADLSRTFCYGKATVEQEKMYALVRLAQEKAIGTIIPENKAADTMKIAEKTIGRKMPHALGHGIGLETHDFPGGIHSGAKWKYAENMAVAIEPGYYGKRWGIRIEDDVLVTKRGNMPLSKAPKKLIEI